MSSLVGQAAPQFSLTGVDGSSKERSTYSLRDCLGEPVVLVFYPKDNSPVCTAQLRSYSHDFSTFAEVGAKVFALSPQTLDEHETFIDRNGPFAFPLLADTEKEVGENYGILGPIGFYRRSVVVVDSEGIVRWARKAAAGLTFRPVDEIVAAVKALS